METKITKSPFKKVFRELILLKRLDEPNDKTEGGIIIPETQREKVQKAIVIHVGEGKWLRKKKHKADLSDWRTGKYGPMYLSVGDKVIIENDRSWAFILNGEEFIAMRESDALAVIS